jgi:hypothetical protein
MVVIIMLPLPDDCYIISVAELNLRQIMCLVYYYPQLPVDC